MTLDFVYRLSENIESLSLDLPNYVGNLDREDSIALYALPGGRTIQEFYDGVKDKQLNYEFSVKTKDQETAITSLDTIAQHLEDIVDIPSINGSYDFQNISIVSESYFVGQDESGFFFYRLTIQPKLTIYKEEKRI